MQNTMEGKKWPAGEKMKLGVREKNEKNEKNDENYIKKGRKALKLHLFGQ